MRVIKKVFFSAILIVSFLTGNLLSQEVKINEVMFDPRGSEYYDEFIELYNRGADTISLQGFKLLVINSSGSFIDSLVFPDSVCTLAPGEYCLILDRGYLIEKKSTLYDYLIPDTVTLLTIMDNSFGGSGLKNTEPNEIFLLNQRGDTVSHMVTSPDQLPGYSDEKIDPDGLDYPSNWGNSRVLDGTPGFKNSIAPPDYDVGIASISIDSSLSDFNRKVIAFSVVVKNKGKVDCDSAGILCGLDMDMDSLLSSHEILYDTAFAVKAGEERCFRFRTSRASHGENYLICRVLPVHDENSGDNVGFFEFYVPFRRGAIVFNEIMYNPLESQGGEWIEFYNTTEDTIDIKGWKIRKKGKFKLITPGKCFVPPHGYFVVSNDMSVKDIWEIGSVFLVPEEVIPSLNNSGDSLGIVDASGKEIDFVRYSNVAPKGLSLERLNPFCCSTNPLNWEPTTNEKGGTPGEANSRLPCHRDLEVCEIKSVPSSYVKKGDSLKVSFGILNCGIEPASYFVVDISVYSRRESSPVYQLQRFYYDTLQFFEKFSDSVKIPVLEYGVQKLQVKVVYSEDEDTLNNVAFCLIDAGYPPKSVLINEIMYYPEAGAPEWIEIYNPTDIPVNLENFRLRDSSGKVSTVSTGQFFILPDSFVVITSDKDALLQVYNIDSRIVVQAIGFPGLNNSQDSIVIIDAGGFVQDSLFYTKYFGYRQGVSLERISPFDATNSVSNWGLSQSLNGATPGNRNSIARPDFDLVLDTVMVRFEGEYPFRGDSARIDVIVRNAGLLKTDLSSVTIQLENPVYGTLYKRELLPGDSLEAGEKRVYSFKIDSLPGGVHTIFSHIESLRDENPESDSLRISFGVSYHEQTLIINEIMYAPESGEPEWVEVYNRSSYTVDFTGWCIRDANGKWSVISSEPLVIPPGGFVVVAERRDFLVSFPDFNGKVVFPGNFPVLNNSSDSLFLADANFHPVDVVFYRSEYGGGGGVSLERRDPDMSGLTADNWGPSASQNGATPGLKNSILKYEYDVSVKSFAFRDTFSATGKENPFVVKLKNTGRKRSFPLSLEICFDGNFDGKYSDDEIIWKLGNVPPLPPDSALKIEGIIFTTGKGYCEYRAIVKMENDRDSTNNTFTTYVISRIEPQEVTINEFLAYPNGDQSEFIEFYNTGSLPVNLRGSFIRGNLRTVVLDQDFVIQPGDYSVIAQDSSLFDYFSISTEKVLIPGRWVTLNNISGRIELVGPSRNLIDSLMYSDGWQIVPGRSLEKTLPELPSWYRESWGVCRDEIGATPGAHNSITPYQFDISIDSVLVGDTLREGRYSVRVFVSNKGLNTCEGAEVLVVPEKNTGEGVFPYVLSVDNLVSGGSEVYELEISELRSGINRFRAFVNWKKDMNKENDTLFFEIGVPFPEGCLLLSEFLAIPQDEKEYQTEFIELYNASAEKICLDGWYLSDSNVDRKVRLTTNRCILPGSFLVISADSAIFNYPGLDTGKVIVMDEFPLLNNTEDRIVLYDVNMLVIDSLEYDKDWNMEPGKSMERVSYKNANTVFNWKKSRSQYGCTPGEENSVTLKIKLVDYGIKVFPNPFTPDGDGVNDVAGIHFKLPFDEAVIDVAIYDLFGRLIYVPAKKAAVTSVGTVYWDGSSRYADKARVGMYIVRLNAREPTTGRSTVYITTIILAGKL